MKGKLSLYSGLNSVHPLDEGTLDEAIDKAIQFLKTNAYISLEYASFDRIIELEGKSYYISEDITQKIYEKSA